MNREAPIAPQLDRIVGIRQLFGEHEARDIAHRGKQPETEVERLQEQIEILDQLKLLPQRDLLTPVPDQLVLQRIVVGGVSHRERRAQVKRMIPTEGNAKSVASQLDAPSPPEAAGRAIVRPKHVFQVATLL